MESSSNSKREPMPTTNGKDKTNTSKPKAKNEDKKTAVQRFFASVIILPSTSPFPVHLHIYFPISSLLFITSKQTRLPFYAPPQSTDFLLNQQLLLLDLVSIAPFCFMASLVLLFKELLHPEDAKLVINKGSLLSKSFSSSSSHGGGAAAALGKRVFGKLAEDSKDGSDPVISDLEDLGEMRISIESIWP